MYATTAMMSASGIGIAAMAVPGRPFLTIGTTSSPSRSPRTTAERRRFTPPSCPPRASAPWQALHRLRVHRLSALEHSRSGLWTLVGRERCRRSLVWRFRWLRAVLRGLLREVPWRRRDRGLRRRRLRAGGARAGRWLLLACRHPRSGGKGHPREQRQRDSSRSSHPHVLLSWNGHDDTRTVRLASRQMSRVRAAAPAIASLRHCHRSHRTRGRSISTADIRLFNRRRQPAA